MAPDATAAERLPCTFRFRPLVGIVPPGMQTLSPLDFMDFRDFINPASGFQSLQWYTRQTVGC